MRYEVDPLTCRQCGAKMKILAFIIEPSVIRRILDHLDHKASQPRAPPLRTELIRWKLTAPPVSETVARMSAALVLM